MTPKTPAIIPVRRAPVVVDREVAVVAVVAAVVATTNAAAMLIAELNLQSLWPPPAPLGRVPTYSSFMPIILRHSHRSCLRSHATVTGTP